MWRVPRLGNRIFTTTTPRQVLFSGKGYSTSSHIAFDARNENLHKLFQLITYSAKGRVEDLKDFFDENPDFNVSMADYDGRTALHLAAEGNSSTCTLQTIKIKDLCRGPHGSS